MTGRRLVIAGALVALLCGGATARAQAPAADLAAARELQTLERWAPSESLATAALGRLEQDPGADSLAIADALHLIATARWKLMGYSEGVGLRAAARSLGIRERRLGADHLEVAVAHSLLGRFLAGTGRPDSARVHVRRALDIRAAQRAPDDTLVARTWDQLALVERDRLDFRGALDAWHRAIEIRQRVHGPDHPEVARLMAQTGVPWMELGDPERARQVLEAALGMFERTVGRDHPGRWIPLNILADVESRLGNWARDVDLLHEALRIVRNSYGENSREALTVRGNLANRLQEVGDDAGARALWAPLLPRLEAQYGAAHPRALTARLGLAVATSGVGDTAAALALMRETEALMSTPGAPPNRDLPTVRALQALILNRQGRHDEARRLCESGIVTERSRRAPDFATLGSLHVALLRVLEESGDRAALDSVRRELVDLGKRHDLAATHVAARVEHGAARAARRLGRDDEAWQHALEAERLSRARLAASLQTLPDRRALHLMRNDEAYLELVIDLAREGGPDRRIAAWDRLVRSRGLVRAEIARRRPMPGFESDTGVTGSHARWIAAQRRYARRLVAIRGSRADSAGRAELEALRAAADVAEADYARSLTSRGAKVPTDEIGLADVRASLEPGAALVGCYASRRIGGRWLQTPGRDTVDLIAFVARGGSDAIERIELGTSVALREVLDPWRERLARSPGPFARPGDRAERESRRLGRDVRTRVWDRIASHLAGAKEVYLVADGPLLDLPWHALPDGANGYLVQTDVLIHVLHAERELVERSATSTGSLLAIGAPDYDLGAPAGAPALAAGWVRAAPDPCAAAQLPAFTPLPGSGQEARAVAGAWRARGDLPATVLTGAEATERTFKQQSRGRAIIHLATHGVVAGDTCATGAAGLRGVGGVESLAAPKDRRRPAAASPPARPTSPSPWMARRVWLALAGANHAAAHQADENEGFLTAEEVITLDLEGTDWVVLSACHSGLAESWSREGMLGMRRAFDLAGARTVIASQWAVADDATREWMEALYAARAAGASTGAAAVASASRAILGARRQAGRSTHPFYWAAFGASGR